jgi:hypothetical protein
MEVHLSVILGFPNTMGCYLNFTNSKVLISNKFELQILMETKSKKIEKEQKKEGSSPTGPRPRPSKR